MELILLIIASVLIARFLERTKYRVAVMAHAVLFIFLSFVYFFGTDLALFARLGRFWFGAKAYDFLHEAFATSSDGLSLGFTAFFVVEIVLLLSIAALAMIAMVRSYKRILKLVRMRACWGFIEADSLDSQNDIDGGRSFGYRGKTYLALGRLRN